MIETDLYSSGVFDVIPMKSIYNVIINEASV